MGVKIHKCEIPWNEIHNKETNNLCESCSVCVPDISNKALKEVETGFLTLSCARIHDRHLEENEKEFFVINMLESKLRNLGWLRLASVTVFVYLLVTGCHTRRTAGIPAYANWDRLEKSNYEPRNQNSEMSTQVERD